MAGFLEASSSGVTLHPQGSSTRPIADESGKLSPCVSPSRVLVAPEQRVSGHWKGGEAKAAARDFAGHSPAGASACPCYLPDQQGGGGRSCRLTTVSTWEGKPLQDERTEHLKPSLPEMGPNQGPQVANLRAAILNATQVPAQRLSPPSLLFSSC